MQENIFTTLTFLKTPNGYRTIRHLKTGSCVCTDKGVETIEIEPLSSQSPIYAITMEDGRCLYASDEQSFEVIEKDTKMIVDIYDIMNALEEGLRYSIRFTDTADEHHYLLAVLRITPTNMTGRRYRLKVTDGHYLYSQNKALFPML